MRLARCQRVKLLKWLAISDHPRQRIRVKDVDARHIDGSDAVLGTAMSRHDEIDRTSAANCVIEKVAGAPRCH